jgi:cyclic pyranopterin phosphate synthase
MRPTHLDDEGAPRMVDVGDKPVTARRAVARSVVRMRPDVLATILDAGGPKGDVLVTARLAGIGAAKRTSELIPLCHPLPLDNCKFDITFANNEAVIRCTCKTTGKTGVEMEALTGASVASLAFFDMIKAIDPAAVIHSIRVLQKSGGKSDFNAPTA